MLHGEPRLVSVVQTFEFEGHPGHVSPGAITFVERESGTMLRMVSTHQSIADPDAMIAGGVERGLNEGPARLETLLDRRPVPALST